MEELKKKKQHIKNPSRFLEMAAIKLKVLTIIITITLYQVLLLLLN